MARLVSTPTTLTIRAPGSSALAMLAASMPAGSWAQVMGVNQSALTDNDGAGSGSHLHYSNAMSYIPQTDRIQIIAADHGSYSSMFIIEFDLATNQFVTVAPGTTAPGYGTGTGPGHGFDHAAVNPYTGDAYQVHYGQAVTYRIVVAKRARGAASFATTLPTTMIDQSANITYGACWWSGAFTGGGGAGAQGCLMVFNQGNSNGAATDGVMNAYDPLTNQWFFSLVGASPNFGTSGTYHALAEYSPLLNCMVYGGGNAAPRKLWRMDSNASVTRLTDVPAGKSVGIQRGNLVADPVTGKFLLLSAGELWELDPRGAGTWVQQTGNRAPPAGVGSPDALDGIMSVGLPTLGVVAYLKQSSASGGTFYLYKHA